MEKKLTAPSYWHDKPEWFKENDWLVQNQEHSFVKRLSNAIKQIQQDQSIKQPDQEPMEATKACLYGSEAADGTRFQYNQALAQLVTLSGEDRLKADEVMEKFKSHFSDYMGFLES